MESARVLDVGQCNPDHAGIRRMFEQYFDVEVDRTMSVAAARRMLAERQYDLVLVNRLIFEDGSDGLELVRKVREDETMAAVPVMMVSNLDDAQQSAVEAGAVPGFGKASLNTVETLALIARYVPRKAEQPS